MKSVTLEELLGCQAHIAILRTLCQCSSMDFSISELARETGMDKSIISRAISKLEKYKAVLTSIRGRLKLCRINKKSQYYIMLEKLFSTEAYLTACDAHD